jgi:stearoyl-CoA 9-desaturase NADPH oxidoreductase
LGVITATFASSRATTALSLAIRRLAEAVASPLVPDDYLDLLAPLRTTADLRGRVVSVTSETRDAATVEIRPGRSWKGHRPGQYVRLGVDVDGVRHWRAYSLTSEVGRSDGLISITAKAIPDGTVSNYVVRLLRPGTLVHLDQATGDFVLPQPLPAKALFVTAGSGITPVMGLLRNQLADLNDVILVHSAPRPDDVIFGDQLRNWARAGRLRLVERHTESSGILAPARLDDLVPDWRDREAWACGPIGLLDAMEAHWAHAGLSDRLHTERFRSTLITHGEGGTVTFLRQRFVVEADGATPLLDVGEDAGVLMPSGCRMGICFGCTVPLRQGAVRDLRDGQLTTVSEGDSIHIQTCVSAAAGRCQIDL